MSKVKITDQKSTLNGWSDVDSSLNTIAVKKLEVTKLESAMNGEKLKVQQKYQPQLDKLNSEILGIEKNMELYCNSVKDEFDKKKSRELNYGIVSFRKGTPRLATLKGFTWDAVKNLVKVSKKYAKMFIRTKVELDKEKMLKAGLKESELAKLGVHIAQNETFSYEVFAKESVAVETES